MSRWSVSLLILALGSGQAAPGLKTEAFDRDPGWDARNNRSAERREIKQDFGYDAARGKVGGLITPAAEPAYVARILEPRTLKEPLAASGTLVVEPGAGNTLIGFFNAGTINEWRTPSSIALRVNGRGEGFHVHLEYATSKWRAGADMYAEGRSARLWPAGKGYAWTLAYDPKDGGSVRATLNGEELRLRLDAGHQEDGATFNRFGILNVLKSADGGGTLWLDDVEVNGARETFDADPRWDALNARRSYATGNIRPRFDFGYSPTSHAGGKAAGEMGGLVFRGDERFPGKMAYYGDRLRPLTLERPLKASGRVVLRRGVTDSSVLIGFFHSTESLRISQAQASGFPENFLGAAIEGPSREGFLFYPVYAVDRDGEAAQGSRDPGCPRIYPDGVSHAWTLEYADGILTVALDGRAVSLPMSPEHRKLGARFDRFGLVTTHIDGNGQEVYFDDLTYTWTQDAK
jgi:hypothetical protein